MRRILFSILICFLLLKVSHGQTISKKEARQMLEKALSCLQTSDTICFINLWQVDYTATMRRRIISDFYAMRQFLDTALNRDLKISDVEIERHNLKNSNIKYWIKAWFKYGEHAYKGFGFYVAYQNNRWIVRGEPSTSTMRKN